MDITGFFLLSQVSAKNIHHVCKCHTLHGLIYNVSHDTSCIKGDVMFLIYEILSIITQVCLFLLQTGTLLTYVNKPKMSR